MKPHWIEGRLGQLGIDVRQNERVTHDEMRLYIQLLKEEISATERFILECGGFLRDTEKPTKPTNHDHETENNAVHRQ